MEGGPAIAAHRPGPETHCVYERIASRRQANRITEAESHEGAHGNRITESQILRFGSTKGLKSQISESHVRFKQSQRNRRNRHKNDDLCDFMHKNEHSRPDLPHHRRYLAEMLSFGSRLKTSGVEALDRHLARTAAASDKLRDLGSSMHGQGAAL